MADNLKLNAPAFDAYVRATSRVITDPEDPRAAYVVDYDELSYCDCPVSRYGGLIAVAPVEHSRDFTDAIWRVPDSLDLAAINEYLDPDEKADAICRHFKRAGWAYAVRDYGYSTWARYVVAVPQDAGNPDSYGVEIDAWLCGEVYTVTGWYFDGEDWTEYDTLGGVYADNDDDFITVGRDCLATMGVKTREVA